MTNTTMTKTNSTTVSTNSMTNSTTITRITNSAKEVGIFVGLFVIWQYAVWLKGRHTPVGAISRGRLIYHTERFFHIAWEGPLQRISHPLWALSNTYYATAHAFAMLGFVIWVATKHRDRWRFFRNVFFGTTFLGLAFQFLLSSAPPRFIGARIVDTASLQGMSIYHAAGHVVDQYSTFPSLHVAWAAIIALCACQFSLSKWRYIWVAHLPLTIFVVTVTGNHFILDSVAGSILTFAVFMVVRLDEWRNVQIGVS